MRLSLSKNWILLLTLSGIMLGTSVSSIYGEDGTIAKEMPNLVMTHEEFLQWYQAQPAVITEQNRAGSIQTVSISDMDSPKTTLSARLESNTYILGAGDVISIVVQGKPEFSRDDITLNTDGLISLTMIGEIKANGKSTQEVTQEITERLKEYLKEPNVSILLKKTRPQVSYVIGAVKSPGPYIQVAKEANDPDVKAAMVTTDYRLTTAIANAGGALEDADLKHIHVFNHNLGYQKEVNVFDLIIQGRVQSDLTLKPDDVIYIPRLAHPSENDMNAFKVFANSSIGKHTFQVRIYGLVQKPDLYELKAEEMTLQTVLAKAGGFQTDANPRKVFIARVKPDGKLDKIVVDSTQTETNLQSQDIVLVSNTRSLVKVQKAFDMLSLVLRPFVSSSFVMSNLQQIFDSTGQQ
jgi:polysaccharide biosynthesis/export protein